MQKLYEEWLGSNEQWSRSNYVVQLQQSHEFTKVGARRWMTYQEIAEKYKSNDVADCIVEEKQSNKALAPYQIKRHPDCPKRDEPKLHLLDVSFIFVLAWTWMNFKSIYKPMQSSTLHNIIRIMFLALSY